MNWEAIYPLLESQHELVTTRQLIACGGTEDSIRWTVTDGKLTRNRQGVYALAGSAATPQQALMSACLAAGPNSAVSHMAAAWLWGSEHVAQPPPELTSFDGYIRRLPGVITHRSTLDRSRAIKTRDGIPTVAASLTIVQLAANRTPILVERVANDLVKMHCTNFREILEWVDIVGYGRRQALRALCQRAIDVGGHDDSPAARTLCEKLIRAGIDPFEVDYIVETPYGILLIDIAWPKFKLGIEYNGARDHGWLARSDDARRRSRLAAMGWRMLDVERGMTHDEVIQLVREALAEAKGAGAAGGAA